LAEKPDKTDKNEKDKGIRVYELAKELKIDSRRLIDLLHRLQVENIRNHMSTVEAEPERVVRDIMQGKLPPAPLGATGNSPAPAPAAKASPPVDNPPAAAHPASDPAAAPAEPLSPPRSVPAQRAETSPAGPRAPYPDRGSRPTPPAAARTGVGPRPGSDGRPGAPMGDTNGRFPHAPSAVGRPTSAPPRPPVGAPRPVGGAPNRPPVSGAGRPPMGGPSRPPAPGGRPPMGGPNRPVGGPARPMGSGAGRSPMGGPGRPTGSGSGRPPMGGPGRPTGSGAGRPPMGGASRPSGSGSQSGPGAPRPRPAAGRPGGPPPAAPARGKDQPNRRAVGGGKDRRGSRQGGAGRGRRWQDDDFGGRIRRPKTAAKPSNMPPVNRRVVVAGPVTVKDFADQLGVKSGDLIRRLMDLGVMATLNHELDRETAVIVAGELGVNVEERATQEEREGVLLAGDQDEEKDLVPRPPVITVMGHVDHGKTSLLDRIRSTRVTAQEAGGITQHIGASVVEWNGHRLVFLDTPGHEAFTAMRARGAQVTDLAVLVVAANDGVMPQTVEAINHARAAGVPVVVAINKIDLEGANPERVKQGLTEHELVPEEWGGDTIMVPVSAVTGEGIDRLLASLVAQAEVLELTANPDRPGQGTIIEAQLDRGRGPVATVLVQRGTLKVGDAFVSGRVWGRVRALINDRGERVESAGPSMPVEVLGFNEVPGAGDDYIVLADDKQAREIAEARHQRRRARETDTVSHGVSLDEFYQRLQDSAVKDLNLVVKADVQGSAEALAESLSKIDHAEARVRILHTGVGAVTESDVMLAAASHAIVVGFGVGTEGKARRLAEQEHVDVRMYRVIYDAIDDVRNALTGLLAPKFQEVVLGRAEIREVFKVPRIGTVAGCYVTEGKVTRGAQVRVLRDGKVVHEGPIASLRRFKDDVREVATGYECGVGLERFSDVKVGDQFEVFAQEQIPASQAG